MPKCQVIFAQALSGFGLQEEVQLLRKEKHIAVLALGFFLIYSVGCSGTGREEKTTAIELGPGTHLFVDDYLVADLQQVWRTLNRPSKHPDNPLLKPDRPWEGYLALQPGTVLFDEEEGLFKMWYNALASDKRPDVQDFLCYATSQDGITWEKPDLGLVEFRGSKKNNIFLKWSFWTHSVIKDTAESNSQRRYKLLYFQAKDRGRFGIWAAFSPDGKRWTNYPENPVVPFWATGDTFQVTQDPETRQFILYHKTISRPVRKVSRMVSDDFIHWESSRQVLEPDEYDPPDTEFYGISAFPYAGQYLGMLWIYHTYSQFMDTQLVSSRDGIDWERSVGRRRFFSLAPDGGYRNNTFDSGMVFPSSSPIVKDGKVWIYYSGFTNLHNAPSEDHDGQIGLGTMRQDGFVSLDATSEGSVLTRPLKLKGSSLWVNMTSMTAERINFERDSGKELYNQLFSNNTSARGYLRVEIQDSEGRALAGYEASNCRPLEDNNIYEGDSFYSIPRAGTDIYQKVVWEGDRELSSIGDRTVRLKFILGNTKLYSFKLE